jgi:transketolase
LDISDLRQLHPDYWEPDHWEPDHWEKATVRRVLAMHADIGWDRWPGKAGFVAMPGFGASGPAGERFTHFDSTPEAVAEKAEILL